MKPEIYFQIALFMVRSGLLTSAFSIPEFLAQGGGGLLTNVGAQLLGYGFGVVTERPFESSKLLPPIISSAPQAYEFVTQVTGATRVERVATLAFLLSGTGLLSKTGDPVVNAGAGGFIYLLSQYIEAMTKSGGDGSIPFIATLPSRRFRRFSRKQHLQCQLAIVGIFIFTAGCGYVIVSIYKKNFNYLRVELKKFKNSLRKCSKMKNKFSSKPKVQFIPLT